MRTEIPLFEDASGIVSAHGRAPSPPVDAGRRARGYRVVRPISHGRLAGTLTGFAGHVPFA